MAKKLEYHTSVNYSLADPMKVLAQQEGLATAKNMPKGLSEVQGTRGESAYIFDIGGGRYGAFVQEGLGTKSLIAQKVLETTGKSHFAAIAQDTVGCIINDLISVGATPVVLNAYWSSSSYDWLGQVELAEEFIRGWRKACDMAGVVWGGGETQSLPGVVAPGALEFAGSAFGMITDKKRLVQGSQLKAGDAIVLVESNGPHANGISLIRQIADGLPDGYQTKLPSGVTYGESALRPTHLYAGLTGKLFEAGVDVHYLSNITGHGWRKLMRADEVFSYIIDEIPPVDEIFDFIAAQAQNDTLEMYSNYNMGAGYAIYAAPSDAAQIVKIAKQCGLKAWKAGKVEKGPKQVVIKPLDITFAGDTLEVR